MAVARMNKVTVFFHRSRRDDIVATLERLGALQVLDASAAVGTQERPEWTAVPSADLEARFGEASYVLRYLNQASPPTRSFLASFIPSRESFTPEQFAAALSEVDLRSVYQTCFADEVRLNEIRARRAQLDNLFRLMEPWMSLPMGTEEIHDTDHTRVTALTVPTGGAEELREELRGQVQFESCSKDRRLWYALALWHRADSERVEAALTEAGVALVSFGDLKGRPRDILAAATAELDGLAEQETEIRDRALKFCEQRLQLMAVCDHLSNQLRRAQVQDLFAGTGEVGVVQGWVRQRDVAHLRSALWELGEVEMLVSDPDPDDNVPVSLINHPLIEPFEVVTNLYGFPKYNEIDPTPLLAPFFFLFFGFALTDAGYGIALLLLGWLAIKKLGIPRSGQKLIRLLMFGGASSFVLGALTGSWFGDMPRMLPEFMAGVSAFARSITVIDPIADPIRVLLVALGLGVVQLLFGVGIRGAIIAREGRWLDAIFDQGSWLVLLPGIILLGVGGEGQLGQIGRTAALVGAAGVVVAGARRQKNWLLKPFSGLYNLYGMVNYVGDVLSYARLLALGLATAVIGSVVNQIAQLVGGVPVVGVVLALGMMAGGHVFNLLVNTLGSFVHSGRLQFVEFFTKFFEGGGRPFRPYRWEGTYITVHGDAQAAETVSAAPAVANESGGM